MLFKLGQGKELLKPRFSSEMLVLFGIKRVRQLVGWKSHVVIRDDFAFLDVLFEDTALDELFWQTIPFVHVVRAIPHWPR
jgi:hypothetical protein